MVPIKEACERSNLSLIMILYYSNRKIQTSIAYIYDCSTSLRAHLTTIPLAGRIWERRKREKSSRSIVRSLPARYGIVTELPHLYCRNYYRSWRYRCLSVCSFWLRNIILDHLEPVLHSTSELCLRAVSILADKAMASAHFGNVSTVRVQGPQISSQINVLRVEVVASTSVHISEWWSIPRELSACPSPNRRLISHFRIRNLFGQWSLHAPPMKHF